MKKLLLAAAATAAIAGCNVNVSSNDARTQETLNSVQETAKDLGNQAGNFAAEAGDTLSNAAKGAGEEVQDFGNSIGDRDGNEGGGNKQ
jgi:type IV secretory pathway TrbL component